MPNTNRWATWGSIALSVVIVGGLVWRAVARAGNKPASEGLHQKVKKLVARHPHLQPLYDQATADGVLTLREAEQIVGRVEG